MSIPSFVQKDIDLMRMLKRIEKRNERYPSWRQVFYDCSGICQYPINNDGEICGSPDNLEFHEIYTVTGKIIQIALLCNYHHYSLHQTSGDINGRVNQRHYPSKLQLDMDIEFKLADGIENWKQKYNIIDRRVNYDFSIDYCSHEDCTFNDENS